VALIVSCWAWGSKYGPDYVEKLRAGVARNLPARHEFRVFTPPPEDEYLTREKGCFARLRAFDPEWQAAQGINPGDRIVTMDLDLVVTGSLDGLFYRSEPFTILQGVNASNPCPFNGSLWALDAGYRPDVWHEFSLDLAGKIVAHDFPDDQGWMWDMIPDAAAFGPEDGVYAFQKKSWPKGEELPKGARIVAFPGWRDPSQYTRLDWVRENWR
jgi:hypothetical protein